MGIVSRFFSMLFLITLPVRLIIWSLTILFIFSIIAIDRLITYSGYYNLVRLQNYVEEKNDDFLKKVCSDKSFGSCMMVTSVFSRDDQTIVHSYAKYINQERELKTTQFASTIQVDKDMITNTNLAVLKTLREGCVELERTTADLVRFYKIQVPESYSNSYICFKRNTYFSLFTKGAHCETCGVKLNEYFKRSSFTIYYGFESGFFDRVSRYLYENISGFFSARSEKIKRFFIRGAKKISKTALVKISNDASYQKPENLVEHKSENDLNDQPISAAESLQENPNSSANTTNKQDEIVFDDGAEKFTPNSKQNSSKKATKQAQLPSQLKTSQNQNDKFDSEVATNNNQYENDYDDNSKYFAKIDNSTITNTKSTQKQAIKNTEGINYDATLNEMPTDN